MKYLYYSVLFSILLGCHKPPESKNKIEYHNIPNLSLSSNQVGKELILDTIFICTDNENELTSMEGIFFLQKDTIYFADKQLATIFLYDLKGKFIKTYLSRGKGPNEILGLNTITPLEQGGYAIMDEQWNIFIFDQQWKRSITYQIDWQCKKTIRELYNNPDPNEKGIYEVEYAANNLRPISNKYLIFPIVTEHLRYNGYEGTNAEHFYKNSYTLGLINITNGQLKQMMCNRSPVYSQYKYLPNFKNVIFETNQDTLYYSFEADSLIYQINFQDSSTISYGYKGNNMNTRYVETNTFQKADDNYITDRKKFGFYSNLKYISETGILFRSVHYGSPQKKDGIQCYRDHIFIGEFEVPLNFQVIGYCKPYYYAVGEPDLAKEEISIYKFKLEI